MEEDGFSNMDYIKMSNDAAETEKSDFYSASKTKCFNTFKELLSQVIEQQTTQQGTFTKSVAQKILLLYSYFALCIYTSILRN